MLKRCGRAVGREVGRGLLVEHGQLERVELAVPYGVPTGKCSAQPNWNGMEAHVAACQAATVRTNPNQRERMLMIHFGIESVKNSRARLRLARRIASDVPRESVCTRLSTAR